MRKSILVFLLITAWLLVAGLAPVIADGLSKVTGGIQFSTGMVDQGWMQMNVHQLSADTAHGWIHWKEYSESEGWHRVVARPTCMVLGNNPHTATVVVKIVEKTGWGSLVKDQYVRFWVYDGGTPGAGLDHVGVSYWPQDDEDFSIPECVYTDPFFGFAAERGNLVVHD
jgi:hypothetical protein